MSYDQGGYFIIKGKEKVFLSQEKKVNNILYINKSSKDDVILEGNIKSISNEGFQSSRTNYVTYRKVNLLSNGAFKKELNEKYNLQKKFENIFTVRILGLIVENGGKDLNIPLFILFRALGIEKDKEILNLIIYETDDKILKNKMFDLLRPSIKDSQPIYNQKTALKYISLKIKNSEIINVIDILNNIF